MKLRKIHSIQYTIFSPFRGGIVVAIKNLFRFDIFCVPLVGFVQNGSPGLVVMGCNSQSEGCKFEPKHHILHGHLLHCLLEKLKCLLEKDRK